MFSLTENLSNSYVDQSKLISYMSSQNESEIGMHNFHVLFGAFFFVDFGAFWKLFDQRAVITKTTIVIFDFVNFFATLCQTMRIETIWFANAQTVSFLFTKETNRILY